MSRAPVRPAHSALRRYLRAGSFLFGRVYNSRITMAEQYEDPVSDVVDFVGRFLEDTANGKPGDLDSYVRCYPQHEAEIRRAHDELVAELEAPLRRGSEIGALPETIGSYEVLERLGSGGQGIVYLVSDPRLQRRVALKVLHPAMLGSRSARERFRREAEIISGLDDPGLCSVYEAGLDGDVPYIAMRYLEGKTLSRHIADARTGAAQPDSENWLCKPRGSDAVDAVLAVFEELARSLHIAHEAAVIHRDIKPGNVIATSKGRLVLCDFGLARSSSPDAATLTLSGDSFGTPAYMSPEQLTEGATIDRRTDVYSLGVTLYETLTLERPFKSADAAEQRRAILIDRLPNPTQFNSSLSPELATLLETATEKELERRYQTASEFADELARVRTRQPIHARPASVAYRLSKFVQRHKRLAAMSVALLALIAIAIYSIASARNAQTGLVRKRSAEHRVLAANAALTGDAAEARTRLGLSKAVEDGWESDLIRHLTQQSVQVLEGGPLGIDDVQVADNGVRVVVSADGMLHCVDRDVGEWRALSLDERLTLLCKWKLSPSGKHVAVSNGASEVVLLDAVSGEPTKRIKFTWQPAWITFSKDESLVAISSYSDATIRILELSTGSIIDTFRAPGVCSRMAFVGEGRVLAGVSTSSLWRREGSGDARELSPIAPGSPCSLGEDGSAVILDRADSYTFFGPDGVNLYSGPIAIWEVELACSAKLLVAGSGSALQLRDCWTGSLLGELAGHSNSVSAFGLNRHGLLVSADSGGALRVWNLELGAPVPHVNLPKVEFAATCESRTVTVNRSSYILWDAHAISEVRSGLSPTSHDVQAVAVSPSGRYVGFAGVHLKATTVDGEDSHSMALVDSDTGAEILSAKLSGTPRAVAVRDNPVGVAVGLQDGQVDVFDDGARRLFTISNVGRATDAVLWSPDGKRLVVLASDRDGSSSISCWNGIDGGHLWSEVIPNETGSTLSVSHDGSVVASGGSDGGVRVWGLADGEPFMSISGLGARVTALAIHPDGERLAAVVGTRLTLWELSSGVPDPLQLMSCELVVGPAHAARFSDDGTSLSIVGLTGIQRLETQRPLRDEVLGRELARRQRAELLSRFAGVPAVHELVGLVDEATLDRAQFHENVDELNRRAWTVATSDEQDSSLYKRALRWSQRAVQVGVERDRYWNTLGLLYLRLDRFTDAIETFERAEEIHVAAGTGSVRAVEGATPFNLYPMAEAFARLGNVTQAHRSYESAERIRSRFKSRRELQLLRDAASLAIENMTAADLPR